MEKTLVDAYRWHRQQPRALPVRAETALYHARMDVLKGVRRFPRTAGADRGVWQTGKLAGAWCVDAWPAGWRQIGDAHDIVRLNHTGWYCDAIGDSSQIGYVMQLPAHDGKPVYVPGHYNTESDGVTLYPADTYSDKRECAYAADGYAERWAEGEREYNEAWQAGTQAAELTSELATIAEDIKAQLAALAGLHDDAAELESKLAELTSNYGRSDAFKEGLGQ